MAALIPLHGKYGTGKFAIVDEADFLPLSEHTWYSNSKGYVVRHWRPHGGRLIAIWMHREILQTPEGFDTDHINMNTLDNRRSNLRIATRQQNKANQGAISGASVFKGVMFKNGLWYAAIGNNYSTQYLGYFPTQREAAAAYNKAALELFGEYAHLNDLSILAPEDDPPILIQGKTRSHKKNSRFLGVGFDKRRNRYTVQVIHKGKSYSAGRSFRSDYEAARARDELARKLHGPLARLNFP